MSRRRKMCDKLTAAGNPCKNGPGCTVNHQTVPGGPVVAMTAAAGCDPDPFAADDAALPTQGGELSGVLDALQAEAEKVASARKDKRPAHQIRGLLFELVANKWLMTLPDEMPLGEYVNGSAAASHGRQPPQASSLKRVVSWAEFIDENPGWKEFLPSLDEGIDAVGEMSDGQLMAIQHKCWKSDAVLGSKALDTFVGLSNVVHPDDPDAKLFARKLLMMTFDNIDNRALRALARHDVLIMTRTYLEEHEIGWGAALDATRQRREQAPPQDPSRQRTLTAGDLDGDWLRNQYETQRRSVENIASELGCKPWRVSAAMRGHGIPTRAGAPGRPGPLDDGNWLRNQYETQRRSVESIASELGRAPRAVRVELRRHGIPTRERQDLLDAEGWLRYQYETQQRSIRAVANDVDCAELVVWRALRRHGIPTRAYPDRLDEEGWLRDQYERWGLGIDDIAGELRCDSSDVATALHRHGIPIRAHPGMVHDEGWLRDQYENQQRSVDSIAGELGCRLAMVRGALTRFDIPIRPVDHDPMVDRPGG